MLLFEILTVQLTKVRICAKLTSKAKKNCPSTLVKMGRWTSWQLQCTLLVFQQNSPISIVVKPDYLFEKMTVCTVGSLLL